MSAVALHALHPEQGAVLARGMVEREHDGLCRVLCEGRFLAASPAVSCLLRPRQGDEVLLVLSPDQAPLVLAVLLRQQDEGRLRLPGGAELQGDAEGLRVRAPALDLRCERAEFRATQVRALFGRLQAAGHEWLARLERSLVDVGDSMRRVRGMDETRAAQQRVHVQGRMHLRCDDASLVARRRVRIDGSHIDLG